MISPELLGQYVSESRSILDRQEQIAVELREIHNGPQVVADLTSHFIASGFTRGALAALLATAIERLTDPDAHWEATP